MGRGVKIDGFTLEGRPSPERPSHTVLLQPQLTGKAPAPGTTEGLYWWPPKPGRGSRAHKTSGRYECVAGRTLGVLEKLEKISGQNLSDPGEVA